MNNGFEYTCKRMYFYIMINNPSHVDLWIQLSRAQSLILRKVEDALKAAKLPNLSWYDVLLEVERSDPDGLRPFELEEKMLLPQYGVSRLVDRISKAGLISIQPYSEDGRGKRLAITLAGREMRRKMWAVYGPTLETAIKGKLTKSQIHDAQQIMAKLTLQ